MTRTYADGLLACPFCGGEWANVPITASHDGPYRIDDLTVVCGGCGISALANNDQWNARAALSTPQPDSDLVEKVESLCEGCPPVDYPTDKTRCLPCPRRPTLPRTYADGIEDAARVAHAYKDKIKEPHDWFIAVDIALLIRNLSTSPSGIEDAREALTKAAEALKPFAKCADAYHSFDGQHDFRDEDEIGIGAFKATVGDLRKAHDALSLCESASSKIGGDHG